MNASVRTMETMAAMRTRATDLVTVIEWMR